MFAVLLLTLAHCTTSVTAFAVCGNYCGANWCNAQISPECAHPNTITGVSCNKTRDDCSELVQADGSCADSCCKTHDKCCGSLNREVCNDIIISCLERCESGQYDKCKHPGTGVPVHPKVILYAMKLNPNGCCGTRCGKLGANKTRDQLFDEFQKAMQDDAWLYGKNKRLKCVQPIYKRTKSTRDK